MEPNHFPTLTEAMRQNLRKTAVWESCFNSWLTTVRPSVARELLAGDKSELVEGLDNKTWDYLRMTEGVCQMEPAEAMQELFPMWEETEPPPLGYYERVNLQMQGIDPDEEQETPEETPLTEEEEESLTAIAKEAIGSH